MWFPIRKKFHTAVVLKKGLCLDVLVIFIDNLTNKPFIGAFYKSGQRNYSIASLDLQMVYMDYGLSKSNYSSCLCLQTPPFWCSFKKKICIICKHYMTEGRTVEDISLAPGTAANLLVLFTWLCGTPFGF